MKTPKTTKSTKESSKKTSKIIEPEPLKVIHRSPLINAPPSSSSSTKPSDQPSSLTMHAGSKRPNTTPKGGGSSSRPTKKSKNVDPNSSDEVAKEMSVGFGLDKYWYDSTPFPQLHDILKNKNWETLMSDFCCNPIYANLMREFISNFSIENGVCSSVVKEIKIEFNCMILCEWFGVLAIGFDTYYVGSKIVFSRINEKTMLKFLGIHEKKGRISHNTL